MNERLPRASQNFAEIRFTDATSKETGIATVGARRSYCEVLQDHRNSKIVLYVRRTVSHSHNLLRLLDRSRCASWCCYRLAFTGSDCQTQRPNTSAGFI